MGAGYYDPHPLLLLEEPLALVGHPGSGIAQTGRMISGRTGLPFNDIARTVEAMAGRSLARVVMESGIESLRKKEIEALLQALARRPCGVIVLESGSFERADFGRWLQERCRVVHVRRPAAVLLARIRQGIEHHPGSFPDFLVATPNSEEELAAHWAPRDSQLDSIEVCLEAGDEHPHRIAEHILESLDRLMSVEQTRP